MMLSNRSLRIAPAARRDIRLILRNTLQRWGADQRDAYRERLNDALLELTRFPEMGRARDEVSQGLRSQIVGEHVVYYRVSEQFVRILRIVHPRMDVASMFK